MVYSTVQYSLCQVGYRTLSIFKYWICHNSSSLMPPLETPPTTTPTPTCHHSNPHSLPLQTPHATTPTPTCHHSNPNQFLLVNQYIDITSRVWKSQQQHVFGRWMFSDGESKQKMCHTRTGADQLISITVQSDLSMNPIG